MSYLTELLHSGHLKSQFDCGQPLLTQYLRRQAGQDMKRQLAACFVICNERGEVKGYYTLSSAGIERKFLPEELRKKFPPSYQNLPVTLLGRLARDLNYPGERLGELLLIDALKRSYEASLQIGSIAVIVDPIDDAARKFYLRYGFIGLPDSGKMFLPMKTIGKLFV